MLKIIPRYDEKFYKKGEPLDFAKATLNFYGKINPRTTYGDAFKPVDFGNSELLPQIAAYQHSTRRE